MKKLLTYIYLIVITSQTLHKDIMALEEQFFLDCYTSLKSASPNVFLSSSQTKSIITPYLQEITKEKSEDPNNESPLHKELFNLSVNLYSHFSFYRSKVNPYHNICHGFMTMIISGRLYKDINSNGFDFDTYRVILFAGLFHDVAHPGFGNNLMKNENLVARYSQKFLSFKNGELAALSSEIGVDSILEDVHRKIAINYFETFLQDLFQGKGKDGFLGLLGQSIDFTNMNHQFFEMKKTDDLTNSNLLVHFADIAAYASNNINLVQHLAYSCLIEFFYESFFFKNAGLCTQNLKSYQETDDDDEKIKKLIVIGQKFFVDEILIGKNGKFPPVAILDFLPIVNDVKKIDRIFLKNNLIIKLSQRGYLEKNHINLQEYYLFNLFRNSENTNTQMFENLNFCNSQDFSCFKNIQKICQLEQNELENIPGIVQLINDNTELIEERLLI